MLHFEVNSSLATPPEHVEFPHERLVLGVNEKSSGSRKRANLIFTMLQESGLVPPRAVHRVPTVAGGAEANAEVLDSELRAGDLYVAYMGDGGLRDHIGAKMLSDSHSVLATTPTATVAGGNGNNFALSLHKRKYLRNPVALIREADEVEAWPIRIAINYPHPEKRSKVYYANTCFDLNAMAQIAHLIGKDSHRKHLLYKNPVTRFLALETSATTRAVLGARMPSISVKTGEQVDTHERFLYLLANVSHIGKVGRTAARATQKSMHEIEIRHKNTKSVGAGIIGLLRGNSPSKAITETSIELHEPTIAEIDGDAELLPAGTKINARMSQRSHTVLATRPTA
jgi:hypothetical protein